MMEKKPGENPLKFYVQYSNLAIQMIVIIVAGAFGGRELDKYFQWGFPVFTFVLTILAVVGAVFYAMRGLIKKK